MSFNRGKGKGSRLRRGGSDSEHTNLTFLSVILNFIQDPIDTDQANIKYLMTGSQIKFGMTRQRVNINFLYLFSCTLPLPLSEPRCSY